MMCLNIVPSSNHTYDLLFSIGLIVNRYSPC